VHTLGPTPSSRRKTFSAPPESSHIIALFTACAALAHNLQLACSFDNSLNKHTDTVLSMYLALFTACYKYQEERTSLSLFLSEKVRHGARK
jgi:hypothetical protein